MSFPVSLVSGDVSLSTTQWASKGADLKGINKLYGVTCGQILHYLTHYVRGDHTGGDMSVLSLRRKATYMKSTTRRPDFQCEAEIWKVEPVYCK